MKKYFKIYWALLKVNFAYLLAYRSYFYYSMLVTCLWGAFQIVWMLLLTSKVTAFRGWTRDELLLIAANYIFIISIFHLFFSRNFDRFSYMVFKGDLDLILVKPVDSQFAVSVWIFNYANFLRGVIGLGAIIYLLHRIGVVITFPIIINWLVLVFFSIIMIYSIWLLFSTLIIRYPRLANINELLYNINGISRYPPEIIYEMKNFALLVLVPFTISIAIPTKALFNHLVSSDVSLLIGFSIMFFLLARIAWKFSLRYYTSSSS